MPARTTRRTFFSPGSGRYMGTPICPASVASWSTAAGRCKSQAMSTGVRPFFLSQAASLAQVVVLPAPFRPTTRMRACGPRLRGAASPPSSAANSSWKILTICWPGVTLRSTSSPRAFSLTRAMKFLATLKCTSASSRASRTSRRASLTLASLIRPCPRRSLKTSCNLSERRENILGAWRCWYF